MRELQRLSLMYVNNGDMLIILFSFSGHVEMVKKHYFGYTIQSFVSRETEYVCIVFED